MTEQRNPFSASFQQQQQKNLFVINEINLWSVKTLGIRELQHVATLLTWSHMMRESATETLITQVWKTKHL